MQLGCSYKILYNQLKTLRIFRVSSSQQIITVVSFSFEYSTVPKDHKSEEEMKAIAVYLKYQDMCSDTPNWMKKKDGSSSQDRGRPSEY